MSRTARFFFVFRPVAGWICLVCLLTAQAALAQSPGLVPEAPDMAASPGDPAAPDIPGGPDMSTGPDPSVAPAAPATGVVNGASEQPHAMPPGPWSLPGTPAALDMPRSASLAVPPDFLAALPTLTIDMGKNGAFAPFAAYEQGLSLLRAGRNQEAATALATASAHPLAGFLARDAALLAGYAHEGAGGAAIARTFYEKWLAAGPENSLTPTVLLRLGATAAAMGDFPAARDALQRLCLSRPWMVQAKSASALARELFAAGRSDWNPDAPHVALAQAERAIDARRPDAAVAILDRLASVPGEKDVARLDYLRGKADFAKRRTDAALARFRGVRERFPASPIAPWAAYHEARCLWRKTDPESARRMEALLRGVVDDPAVEVRAREVSARHLMLLLTEQGRLAEALTASDVLAGLGRGGELAEQARGLSGVLCFALGRMEAATSRLSEFLRDHPNSDWAPGARYWLGRTRGAVGDDAGAAACHLGNAALCKNTYYGLRSAAQLQALVNPGRVNPASVQPFLYPSGTQAAPPPPASPDCPGATPPTSPGARPPGLQAMQERVAVLDASGMPELAELDLAFLAASAPADAELALAHIRLATRLFRLGPATATARRTFGDCLLCGDPARFGPLAAALYPRRHTAAIRVALAGSDVSENLILGLIRQESFFNAQVVSSAGAVGLMQLLPQTAANMAARVGLKPFSAKMLTDPATNIRLGVEYYTMRHAQYGNPEHTLCSYNAGAGKLAVWMQGLGNLEPDLFVEFIPYEETRDYVRKVLTNAMFYERLPPGD
ncbi:lytic transglycosylase domain-containing protein [Desulfolutivibrio sp.]|uniref:lytic transglycosylase domain-containing protein n=1 Tax=Desulfolutivibrio sp. TaxID=2773296 RepID=UPI002F96E470